MRRYESKPKRPPDGSPLGLQAKFHTMKRDGNCFGCGSRIVTGVEVYRVEMLAGKSPYINLCNKCQARVMSDIMGGIYERSN